MIQISQTNGELERLAQALATLGRQLEVFSAPAGIDLWRSYDELLERIDRTREMLALYIALVIDLWPERVGELLEKLLEEDIIPEELLEELLHADIIQEELLSTDITL